MASTGRDSRHVFSRNNIHRHADRYRRAGCGIIALGWRRALSFVAVPPNGRQARLIGGWEFQSGPCVGVPYVALIILFGSGQTRLLTSLEIGQGADGNMSKFHMHIEPLEKRASEKELVARLVWNEDGLNNRQLAELLRRRIEELDRLAILNSENEKSLALWESRPTGVVVWTTPTFWQRLSR